MTISTKAGGSLPSSDCSESCSDIGGTVTVTLECKIKGSSINETDCNEKNFNATKCDYVVLKDMQHYACDEVKRNYSSMVDAFHKRVEKCDDECPPDSAANVGK